MPTTIKLKLKTKCFTKSSRNQFDLEKLKDQKIVEVFQARLGGKMGALRVLDSDLILANSLKEVLFSTAVKKKSHFRRQRKKTQPWVTKRVWICATRDGSRNNRSTQALKQDQSTET